MTDGVAIFDGEWNILYMNTAGAALLGSTSDGVVGRNFFDVFPDAAGTVWHTFLLRARASDGPTSYRGYFERIDRFYTATIRPFGNDLVHLSFRQDPPRATGVNDNAGRRRPDEVGDRDRLRYLADVSEALSKTLNTGEAAERVAELVVPRLADWAIVAVLDEQGRTAEQVWRHNDPLQTRGHTFGVLALLITGGRPPHTEMEIAEATEVARRASMPIDNARLHAQEANLVETLQRSLLADPPPLNGV